MSEQSKIFSLSNMEKYLGVADSLAPVLNAYQDEQTHISNNWRTEISDFGSSLSKKYNKLLSEHKDSYKSTIRQVLAENGVSTELLKLVQTYATVKEGEKHLSGFKKLLGGVTVTMGACAYLVSFDPSSFGASAILLAAPVVGIAGMYIFDSKRKIVKDGKAEIKRMAGTEDFHKTMLALGELHAKLPESLYEIKLDE